MSKKILIADQSEAVRGVAESLFRSHGFEVVSASDGVEALELARTTGVDLAFLNSGLPEIDGYDVSRQVKSGEKTKDIRIVLFLSTSEIVDQHKLLSSLADDTLNKPFSPQDLLEVVSDKLSIEIEGITDKDDDTERIEAIGDDVEEIDLDSERGDEIDFESIFDDGEKVEQDQGLNGVFLSDEFGGDNGTEGDGQVTHSDVKDKAVEQVDELAGAAGEPEDSIRMAEDQYDLESQHVRPEIEPPHDYNWFIREMKKDLTKSKPSGASASQASPSPAESGAVRKSAAPGKPSSTQTPSDSFATEEIRSSSQPTVVESFHKEEVDEPYVATAGSVDLDADGDRLSLAEKLLVKELARRISDKLFDRLSSGELREIVREALSSLKKM